MILDLVVGFTVAVLAPPLLTSTVAEAGAFFEVGLLLIVGGCLMARQPLENKGRYTEDGTITSAWRIALIGRQMLLAALILFLYAAIVALGGIVVLF
jgi:hypothetical protein